MYVTGFIDGHVELKCISAHTAHEHCTSEFPHLPWPIGVKEEIAMKTSIGIPSERIMEGIQIAWLCCFIVTKLCKPVRSTIKSLLST